MKVGGGGRGVWGWWEAMCCELHVVHYIGWGVAYPNTTISNTPTHHHSQPTSNPHHVKPRPKPTQSKSHPTQTKPTSNPTQSHLKHPYVNPMWGGRVWGWMDSLSTSWGLGGVYGWQNCNEHMGAMPWVHGLCTCACMHMCIKLTRLSKPSPCQRQSTPDKSHTLNSQAPSPTLEHKATNPKAPDLRVVMVWGGADATDKTSIWVPHPLMWSGFGNLWVEVWTLELGLWV